MDVTNTTQQNTVSKESHNSRLPVFRLPPEVLLEIFSILVKEWAISLPYRISLLLSAPENESWTPSYTHALDDADVSVERAGEGARGDDAREGAGEAEGEHGEGEAEEADEDDGLAAERVGGARPV